MYKKFFMGIAAMAALTLVSCSSDDLNSLSDNSSKNEAISFDGYLGRSAVAVNGSRGSVETKDQLKTDGFGVFGNYNSTGGQEFGSNLFNNVKVTGKASTEGTTEGTKWTYDPLKYWPTDGHVDFLAYAPHVANTKLNNTTDDPKKVLPCIDFTVSPTITEQKDLLWANTANKTKADGTVTFNFNHALSRLGYKVKLNDDYKVTSIKLNKITLAGSNDGNGTNKAFYKTGTIDLSYTSSTASSTTKLWKPFGEKQDFEWYSGDDQLSKTTAVENPKEKYLFVIPQKFSASAPDQLYVIVVYTITYSDNTTVKTKVYKQLDKEFLQGNAYTINLNIGLTPIEFNAEVNDWNPKDGESIDASWN